MIYLVKRSFRNVIEICGIYIIWIALHYISTHLYVYFCVPYSWTGFIMSPIQSPMPHCSALRYVIYNGGETINKMWILLGIWLCRRMCVTE